jgi:hypothetical protein
MGFQTIGGLFGAELVVDGAVVDVGDGCDAEVVARDVGLLLMVGVVVARACEEESCVRAAREKTTTDPNASAAIASRRIQNGGRRRA